MLDRVQSNDNTEFYKYTQKISAEWSALRQKELRAVREADEANQKVEHLNKLLKSRNDHITMLEEKAAKAEAEVTKKEQEFCQLNNERHQKFFHAGANNKLDRKQGYQGYDR